MGALLALLVVVSSASAAKDSGLPPQPSVVVYDCDNLATLTGRQFADRLELSSTGQAPMVLHQIGEAPATFADATTTVTMNADYLRMTGPMQTVCRRNLEEAPWQDARLRGVEFRATGAQPDWVLEYGEGHALTFVARDFPPFTASVVSVTANSGNQMIIEGGDGTHDVQVDIERAVCAGASGVTTARVVVTIGNHTFGSHTFTGCGRALASGKFRGTLNCGSRLPKEGVLSIRIARDAPDSRQVLAEWTGAITANADVPFELDYDPLRIFGDDRYTIEASIDADSHRRCTRGRIFVLTWGAFGHVTLSTEMFSDRTGGRAVCGT